MEEIKYSKYKPRTCRGCYWWLGKKKGCERGEENCYYIIIDEVQHVDQFSQPHTQ